MLIGRIVTRVNAAAVTAVVEESVRSGRDSSSSCDARGVDWHVVKKAGTAASER